MTIYLCLVFSKTQIWLADGIKLNGFLNQYFNPTFPAPDGSFKILNSLCKGDSIEIEAQVCNTGQNILPASTPITFYAGNPTQVGSSWVATLMLGAQLPFDSCITVQLAIPRTANVQVYGVLNDDHSLVTPYNLNQDFPVTTIGECNFMNNMDSLFLDYAPKMLNLGMDSLICDNSSLTLDATDANTTTYTWHDGSNQPNFTANDAGVFYLETTDICSITQRDTITIGIDSSTVVVLGADHTICAGENFPLSVPGFDFYVWQPVAAASCPTCSSVLISPHASGNVILTATLNNGCWSSDTIAVTVHDTSYIVIDTTICYGLDITANGVIIQPDSTVAFALQSQYGCDSTVIYRVKGTFTGTYNTQIDSAICKGTSLTYQGVTLTDQDTHVFGLTAQTGCDSMVHLRTNPLDTFLTTESLRICTGATIDIFGQVQNAGGVYAKLFTAANGCDSTHYVTLTLAPPIDISFTTTPTCIDEANGTTVCIATGGTPNFDYNWDIPSLIGSSLTGLEAGAYHVTVTDQINCTETAQVQIDAYPAIVWDVVKQDPLCYGQANGVITASSPDPTLVYSFDNQPFGTASEIKSLAGGSYQVKAQDAFGCEVNALVSLTEPDQLIVSLGSMQTVPLGDSITLLSQVNTSAQLQYEWSPPLYLSCFNCAEPTTTPLFPVRYTLQITDEYGCTAKTQKLIDVDRTVYHYAPNAFAPESTADSNNGFMPFFGPAVQEIKLFQVFDRWGDLQFQAENRSIDDQNMKWFGRKNGKAVLPGVYVWAAQIRLVDGSEQWLRGDVAVVK